jgi:hypothetical protein
MRRGLRGRLGAVGQLELARLDDGGEVSVDVLDAARQRGLHAEAQPLLAPPHALGEDEAVEGGLRGAVERGGEVVLGEAPGERLGVLPEREPADVVEGEAEQQVLEVDVGAPGRRVAHDGQQPAVDGPRHPARHCGAQRARGELERGRLALRHPRLPVGVEDAVAEEVAEHVVPEGALGVVVEPGLEHVLQVPRLAGDRDRARRRCRSGTCPPRGAGCPRSTRACPRRAAPAPEGCRPAATRAGRSARATSARTTPCTGPRPRRPPATHPPPSPPSSDPIQSGWGD